jgi:anti-anti-sigma factor
MTVLCAPAWSLDVDRGPEWLFIRLHGPSNGSVEGCDLADMIWKTMQAEFSKRLVLELNDLAAMRSAFIGQLVILHKRIATTGGTLRLSGLSDHNQEVLSICRLDTRFPHFRNREEAVMGSRPIPR